MTTLKHSEMILNNLHNNELEGVLAIYDKHVSYHKYQDNNLSNGEPLTLQTAKNLFNFLFKEEFANNYFFENIIPPNILYFKENRKKIVWYTKPTKKYLQFLSNLPIEDATYPLPYLVWMLNENNLHIYATKKIPSQKNCKLFHAPFLNVDQSGNVCMGNTKFVSNSNDYQKIIEKVENGFFASLFSHTNHDNILIDNNNIIKMYQKQINNTHQQFDDAILNPISINLKELCND